MEHADVVVIGGGVIGLATARQVLLREPEASVVVLEKEPAVAAHQTGRNSGVVHSGIYYEPGTLKATLVAEGRRTLFDFCAAARITVEHCGKLIVATEIDEVARLDSLEARGRANGLDVRRLGPDQMRGIEPHASGLAALHVPEAAIVDYRAVAAALSGDIVRRGGTIRLAEAVVGLDVNARAVNVTTSRTPLAAGCVVNCAGLHADRLARMTASSADLPMIVPFRGEYYELVPERAHLVRHLLYPVPDPAFPFLGVHFTRTADGSVHAGPNAVLALSREGYRWRDVDVRDATETFRHRGFRRFARRHVRTGTGEVVRSVSKAAFVRALQRLVPDVREHDLVRSGAGVRAQAMSPDGTLLDDFAFAASGRVLHVLNAPSPAATASLAIARHIVDQLDDLA